MMIFDVLWCSWMFYDVLWCSLMFFDVLWCSMMFYGVIWCSLMFFEVLWCSMMFFGVLWCSMMFYDVLWWCMMFFDVLWCSMMFYGVLWCFSALLHCIALGIHRLPYTGGRVSSISDSPISVTPSLKYWAAEKQKPKILGLDPISETRFWLSRPQIWTQWQHDFVLFEGRPEICNNLCHLEVSQVSLWGCRPN